MTSISNSLKESHLSRGIESLRDKCKGKAGAIIGTGTSLNGVSIDTFLEDIDKDIVTIGMNESCKMHHSDFHIIVDPGGIYKGWKNWGEKTRFVFSEISKKIMLETPPFDPYGVLDFEERLLERKCYVARCNENDPMGDALRLSGAPSPSWLFWKGSVVTAALSLGKFIGLNRIYLLGVDFYREHRDGYAAGCGTTRIESLIELRDPPALNEPRRYTTHTFLTQRMMVEESAGNRHWPVDVINLSRHSELECFPINGELALPLRR